MNDFSCLFTFRFNEKIYIFFIYDYFRARIASTSSQKDEKEPSAEEFFIDVILQRHARKLLSAGRLFDLGTFAAQLDFHMVSWLKKESHR